MVSGRAVGRGGPLEKQLHGVAAVAAYGHAGHGEHPLVGHEQPRPAGREHGHARAGRQQPLGQHDDPVHEVLAVVQHEHGLAVAQPGQHRLLRRPAVLLPRPSTAARAGATIASSVTGTRSTYQTPAGNWLACSAATASASRVLPMPPGPTAVTSRCSVSSGRERGTLGGPADERRQRRWRQCRRALRLGERHAVGGARRETGQRAPVAHAELAKQRGDVTLHGPHRDEQPVRDLGVRQVLRDTGEHLRLAGGDTRCLRHLLCVHDVILTQEPGGPARHVTEQPSWLPSTTA